MISKTIGFFLLFTSLVVIYLFEASSTFSGFLRIFHWPAILLTAIGPLGIVLISSEWEQIKNCIQSLFASPMKLEQSNRMEARLLQQTTQQMYHSGLKAFEKIAQGPISPTLKKVCRRFVARVPVGDISDLLLREQDRLELELNRQIKIIGLGLRMAPSVGMLGTILGMVQLLSHIQDPSNIGSSMSLALLTTFYGLFFSLVVWTPLQHRLEIILELRLRSYNQILHWLELIEEKKPIQYFEEHIFEEPQTNAKEKMENKNPKSQPMKTNLLKQSNTNNIGNA